MQPWSLMIQRFAPTKVVPSHERRIEGIGGAMAVGDEKKTRIQIYPETGASASREVTPYWKEKYEKDARKYWDVFYKRHQDKFFKDRHYLDKEWGQYFRTEEEEEEEGEKLVVLEVGCGVGNTIFPLVSTYSNIFIHACDFSQRAIGLVKTHKDYREDQVNAFVCDLTCDDLTQNVLPFSVDIATMVFVLSAVSPEKMPLVLQNLKKVLKPNGLVLLRDYAAGDLAQERFTSKDQKISENFYVRGDGTRAFYFSTKFLTALFLENGFYSKEVDVCCKQVENRSLELLMNRRWIQAVFSLQCSGVPSSMEQHIEDFPPEEMNDIKKEHSKDPEESVETDMGESMIGLFGTSASVEEVVDIKLGGSSFKIKTLGRDHQHTCKSTGLMIWESAHFMSVLLDENPSIVAGKTVLELGCGSAGICSMIAARSAKFVVSTDGDPEALDLLRVNVMVNLEPDLYSSRMAIKKLVWGDDEDVKAVKKVLNDICLDVIIGTDITYNRDAVVPLFQTARELLSDEADGKTKAALILCHIQRHVEEDSIISTASRFGFTLADKMVRGAIGHGGILNSWFPEGFNHRRLVQNSPVNILYFTLLRPSSDHLPSCLDWKKLLDS